MSSRSRPALRRPDAVARAGGAAPDARVARDSGVTSRLVPRPFSRRGSRSRGQPAKSAPAQPPRCHRAAILDGHTTAAVSDGRGDASQGHRRGGWRRSPPPLFHIHPERTSLHACHGQRGARAGLLERSSCSLASDTSATALERARRLCAAPALDPAPRRSQGESAALHQCVADEASAL